MARLAFFSNSGSGRRRIKEEPETQRKTLT